MAIALDKKNEKKKELILLPTLNFIMTLLMFGAFVVLAYIIYDIFFDKNDIRDFAIFIVKFIEWLSN